MNHFPFLTSLLRYLRINCFIAKEDLDLGGLEAVLRSEAV